MMFARRPLISTSEVLVNNLSYEWYMHLYCDFDLPCIQLHSEQRRALKCLGVLSPSSSDYEFSARFLCWGASSWHPNLSPELREDHHRIFQLWKTNIGWTDDMEYEIWWYGVWYMMIRSMGYDDTEYGIWWYGVWYMMIQSMRYDDTEYGIWWYGV